MLIFIQMDGFEEIFFKACQKSVKLSKLLCKTRICHGKCACIKGIMSILEHFNVYEDILNNYLCLRSKIRNK